MNFCINCGKEATELHHVIPLALGGNDINSNKVWLCSKCHSLIHNMNIKTRGTDWKELQRAGIEKAKTEGKYTGKKPIEIDWELFEKQYNIWKTGKQTAKQTMENLNLKPNTFYRRVKDYEFNKLNSSNRKGELANACYKVEHGEQTIDSILEEFKIDKLQLKHFSQEMGYNII